MFYSHFSNFRTLPRDRLSIGEGSGTPLQYSCLENPRDGGVWWAAVHGVAKSRAQLSDFSLFTFMHWRRQWQPTPVFLPGESQGRGAWWAAICGVAQSRTRLKRLSSSRLSICLHYYFKIIPVKLVSFELLNHQGGNHFAEGAEFYLKSKDHIVIEGIV